MLTNWSVSHVYLPWRRRRCLRALKILGAMAVATSMPKRSSGEGPDKRVHTTPKKNLGISPYSHLPLSYSLLLSWMYVYICSITTQHHTKEIREDNFTYSNGALSWKRRSLVFKERSWTKKQTYNENWEKSPSTRMNDQRMLLHNTLHNIHLRKHYKHKNLTFTAGVKETQLGKYKR